VARTRKLQFSALNIVTQPHSPESYVALFRALYGLKRPFPVRGSQHLMIGEMERVDREDPLQGLSGRLYRFDQIDPDAPWFNVESREEASEDELAQIRIPTALKPNLVKFNFVFYPRTHQLYFESFSQGATLGERSLQKFFSLICALPYIMEQFGTIDITVVPEHEQLDRILSMPSLSKLVIDLRRPNPDDLASDEQRVLMRLQKMNTRRLVETLTAERGETIQPDEDVKVLARVAAKNGSVSGTGYRADGDKVEESTVDRPWRQTVHYDEAVALPLDVLVTETQLRDAGD
jgi:hypothetical protein